jgi:hypothetical protein
VLNKYLTILEKIYYKLFVKFHKIEGCFYKHKAIVKSKRIVLYLDYPKFIHLGCTSQMEFYFKRLGYKVINKSLISNDDLLVARTELAYHLRNKDVLWINFDYTKVSKPIINVVLNNIAGYLGLNLIDAKPRTLNFGPAEKSFVALKYEIASGDKYAILNNYIDSHKFGMNSGEFLAAQKAMLRFATKHKKDAGVKLVHVGTKREKEHDPNHYEIVDLDLRGLTSVEEAFILASLDNVINYIGFDAFWLHLFNVYNKGSYIMLKPGFPEMYNRQVRNYVAIPYAGEKNKVTFIRVSETPIPKA